MSVRNITISAAQLAAIRSLEDFDLTMMLSEIHDHGWPAAAKLLQQIQEANKKIKMRGPK